MIIQYKLVVRTNSIEKYLRAKKGKSYLPRYGVEILTQAKDHEVNV